MPVEQVPPAVALAVQSVQFCGMRGPKRPRSSGFLLHGDGVFFFFFCWTLVKCELSSIYPFSGKEPERPSMTVVGLRTQWAVGTGNGRWPGPPEPGRSLQSPHCPG
ncbi:hypothetical protein LX36DRAFT_145175 [Colletotrichum falcatum]|nr:hypothetical protein LX36DRAFT_145175 [Colletotrichum falcatum]